jgi:hypothetical protein
MATSPMRLRIEIMLALTPALSMNLSLGKESATSPRPNGFPSPPRISFPRRDERFALRGPPKAERETDRGAAVTFRVHPPPSAAFRRLAPLAAAWRFRRRQKHYGGQGGGTIKNSKPIR